MNFAITELEKKLLDEKQYFNSEYNKKYISVSQVKQKIDCEFALVESLVDPWQDDDESKAFRVGKYIHSWNESEKAFLEFQEKNKGHIYKKNNDKYSEYANADKAIEIIKKDDGIMQMINSSEKEVVMIENIYYNNKVYPIKIRIDGINMDKGYFYDLKYLKDKGNLFVESKRQFLPVLEARWYLMQMAVYSMIISKRLKTDFFNPFIIMITKEIYPDLRVVQFAKDKYQLDEFVAKYTKDFLDNLEDLQALKNGEKKPRRCEYCKYCITRKETNHIFYMDFDWKKV